MNKEQFKKFVIEEAKKVIFENDSIPSKENVEAKERETITPDDVFNLAEEIKTLNKSVDFRSPLISESVEKETPKEEKITRDTDMAKYNQKKQANNLSESEQDKWQRMLNYEIPKDNERGNDKHSIAEAKFVDEVTDDRYQGRMNEIIAELEAVKGGLDNVSPTVFVKKNLIHVSGEDGQYFADYYGELSGNGFPTIADSIEQIADKYNTYWEWEDAGSIVLDPLD